MAKVGYIFNSEQYDTFTFDRAWMEKYGCCRIIEDSASQDTPGMEAAHGLSETR